MTSRWRRGRFEELLGVFGFENDDVLADLDLVLAQGFAEPFEDGAVPLLPGVADQLRADGVGDGLLDGVGVHQAGQGRGGEERVADGLGGPLGEGRGPEADEPRGTDLVGDLVVLAERVHDQVGQRRGHARIDLAEVGVLDGVALVEQEDVPVGPPDGFSQVGLCALRLSVKSPLLGVLQLADRVVVVVDVLPGQNITGRVGDGGRRVGDGEEQARLERPAGCPALPARMTR